MKRARFTEEQIVVTLRENDAGAKVGDLARKHGISEGTIYAWKAKRGGMSVSEAQRLRTLENENRRLKSLLGSGLIDPEDEGCGESDGREEGVSAAVVACVDASPIL